MKIAYVSGHYRAPTSYGIKKNIQKAEAVQVELLKMGYFVICPHKMIAFLGGVVPEEFFLKGNLEILDRLKSDYDFIVMLEGWEDSQGARGELSRAIHNKLKVYYWPRDRSVLDPKCTEGGG